MESGDEDEDEDEDEDDSDGGSGSESGSESDLSLDEADRALLGDSSPSSEGEHEGDESGSDGEGEDLDAAAVLGGGSGSSARNQQQLADDLLRRRRSSSKKQHVATEAAPEGPGALAPSRLSKKYRPKKTEKGGESDESEGEDGGSDEDEDEEDRPLTAADLVSGLGASARAALGAPSRRALRRLGDAVVSAAPAPLPRAVAERAARKAAYAQASSDLSRWTPLVKQQREAPTLAFSDGSREGGARPHASTAALAASFRPRAGDKGGAGGGGVEAEVAAMLSAARADSASAVVAAERALVERSRLPAEEAAAARGRLAKTRSLLFHQEAKLKRMAKIKSKDYRRRLAKAAKAAAAKIRASAGGGDCEGKEDGDDDGEGFLALEEAELAEFRRAQERVTLKHRNTGKWAKRALKRAGLMAQRGVRGGEAEGTRAALAEQLRLGAELRRKVDGAGREGGARNGGDSSTDASDDGEGDDEEESNGGEEEGGASTRQARRDSRRDAAARAKARAAALSVLSSPSPAAAANGEGEAPEGPAAKGLSALPFMRRAAERKLAAARADARALLAELDAEDAAEAAGDGGVASADAADAHDEPVAAVAAPRGGRFVFGGGAPAAAAAASASDEEEGDGGDASSGDELEGGEAKAERTRGVRRAAAAAAAAADSERPVTRSRASTVAASGGVLDAGAFGSSGWGVGSAGVAGVAGGAVAAKTTAPTATKNKPVPPPPAAAAAAPFLPARTFRGAREGYAFTTGEHGTGYYLSQELRKPGGKAAPAAAAAAAAATAAATKTPLQPPKELARGSGLASLSNTGGHSDPAALQRALVAAAFAGDEGVVAEFAAEKRAQAEREADELASGPKTPSQKQNDPHSTDGSELPGWGSWAGSSAARRAAAAASAVEAARARRAQAASRRKDAHLADVAVSERWDKKANAKFSAPSLPYPFTSAEAHDRSLRQPLGRDYNTDASFRDLTRPSVIAKAGILIKPARFGAAAAAAAQEQLSKPNGRRKAVAVLAGGLSKRSKQ